MMRQLAEVTMALTASAISMETNQTAGRDINDPWIGRLAIIATSVITSLVLYMAGVRPARKWIANKTKNGRRKRRR